MKKNIIYTSLYIISASLFTVLYKYISVKETISNVTSNFGSAFVSTSNIKPPYYKIFILSMLSIIVINSVLIFLIHIIEKKEIKKVFNNISNFIPLIISIIISAGTIFINKNLNLLILFVGLIIYLYFICKKNNTKIFIIIFLFTIIEVLVLCLISK